MNAGFHNDRAVPRGGGLTSRMPMASAIVQLYDYRRIVIDVSP